MRHTTEFIAPDIRPRLKELARISGLTIRQLAAATGINKSRLSALLNAKAPLTVPDLQVLGFALDFDPRDLIPGVKGFDVVPAHNAASLYHEKAAQVAAQLFSTAERKYEVHGDTLTIDTMLKWYHRNGGRLAETDQIDQYISVFPAPKPLENLLIPKCIGQNALAARSLNTKDPQRVGQYLASLDRASRDAIIFSYSETAERNSWQIYNRNMTVDFPGAGPRFKLNYATLLMPVVAANHEVLIVNFSVLLSTSLLDPRG